MVVVVRQVRLLKWLLKLEACVAMAFKTPDRLICVAVSGFSRGVYEAMVRRLEVEQFLVWVWVNISYIFIMINMKYPKIITKYMCIDWWLLSIYKWQAWASSLDYYSCDNFTQLNKFCSQIKRNKHQCLTLMMVFRSDVKVWPFCVFFM